MFIIGNGTLVTQDVSNPVIKNGGVVVAKNEIVAIGTMDQIKAQYPEASFIDAHGGLILPGFIDAHEHIYSMMARGMSLVLPQKADLKTILEKLWWKVDRALTNDLTYKSAMAAYLELVKNGVTTVIDHHASYGAITDSLSAIAQAAKCFSVKSCLCYEVSDRAGKDKMKAAVLENERFIKAAAKDPALAGMMGLHASFTLADGSLSYCAEHAGDAGYHVHIAEGAIDQKDCLEKHHRRVAERFSQFSILGPKTLLAHCIDIDEHEMELIKESKSAVVHNPQSNMNNAAGAPQVLKMMEKEILVGLGTDGYTHDMLASYKAADLLHKHQLKDPAAGFLEMSQAMFQNNREIAGRYFAMPTGMLKKGYAADVIIADYDPPTPIEASNVKAHLLFGISGKDISFTMAQGNIVMKDRKLVQLDEIQIMENCRQGAVELWEKLNE